VLPGGRIDTRDAHRIHLEVEAVASHRDGAFGWGGQDGRAFAAGSGGGGGGRLGARGGSPSPGGGSAPAPALRLLEGPVGLAGQGRLGGDVVTASITHVHIRIVSRLVLLASALVGRVVAAPRRGFAGVLGVPGPVAAGAVRGGLGVAGMVATAIELGLLGGRRRALAHGLEQVGQRVCCAGHDFGVLYYV